MSTSDLDAVIVGSGPGGSTAADVLTAAGWTVVIVEKGDGRARVEKETGVRIKTLARIDVRGGRVVVLE